MVHRSPDPAPGCPRTPGPGAVSLGNSPRVFSFFSKHVDPAAAMHLAGERALGGDRELCCPGMGVCWQRLEQMVP